MYITTQTSLKVLQFVQQ